jgi:hypothetical protein
LTGRPTPKFNSKSGDTRLVVRTADAVPFCITRVECDDPRFAFEIGQEAKRLHFLPVTFHAQGDPGNVTQIVRVHTDLLGGRVAEVSVGEPSFRRSLHQSHTSQILHSLGAVGSFKGRAWERLNTEPKGYRFGKHCRQTRQYGLRKLLCQMGDRRGDSPVKHRSRNKWRKLPACGG